MFSVKGKIKGIPAFSRNFDLKLEDLLSAKENDKEVFFLLHSIQID